MELQFLDIDKYISWYKEISKEVEYAKNNEWKVRHYTVLSYDLHKRYLIDNKNLKSKELSEKALAIAKETEQRIKSAKEYILQVPPDSKEVFYIPSLVEWAQFDSVINSFTDAPKQYTESKSKAAALPEIDRLKDELKRISEDTKPPYLENVSQGIPIITGQKNNTFKNWAFDFADFVSNVYYAKWLHEKIQELTPPDISSVPAYNSPLLQWNISITTLATLFYDLIEKDVITWTGETKGKTIEETNGIKITVARMLCSYFIDKEGNQLNIDTITQTLKPTTPKAKKRINIDNVLPKTKR